MGWWEDVCMYVVLQWQGVVWLVLHEGRGLDKGRSKRDT